MKGWAVEMYMDNMVLCWISEREQGIKENFEFSSESSPPHIPKEVD